MRESTFGWHFVGNKLRDGSPIPRDGVWLPKIEIIALCYRGYHGSMHPFDALQYAPGRTLCWCEYRGDMVQNSDKFCAQERRIITRMDAAELLGYFARMQAVSVAHLWDAPDVVLDFLMTGEETLMAAAQDAVARDDAQDAAQDAARADSRDAARAADSRAAAWAAARDAAWAAARAADSRAAAWAAARDEFATLVSECFGLMEGE